VSARDPAKLAYWERRSRLDTGRPYPDPAPLRPADSDLARYEDWARKFSAVRTGASFDVLMLGVTRPIAAMRWPEGTALVAVDWSRGMIERFWPAEAAPRGASVTVADWREMPLAAASRDMAIGDTCYAALATLEDCAALNAGVARALRPGAHWVLRCFLRPAEPEPLDELVMELVAGRIGVFEIFCWRLAMALHGADGVGVRCDDVWREWHARVPDPRALFERLGWDARILAAIERWQGEATRIFFPSLAEALRLVEADFELVEMRYPAYEMGERCPMLVLRRR